MSSIPSGGRHAQFVQSTTPWLAALFLAAVLFSHTVALRLLLLFIGAALLIADNVRGRLAGGQARVRLPLPLLVAFALWAAWAGWSYLWSLDPARTLKEVQNEIGYTFLALWFCHAAAQGRKARRTLLAVVALAAAAVCAIALYEFWSKPFVVYMAGLHGGPGSHSSALLTLMPCIVMFAWFARGKALPPWVQAAAWALAALCLVSAYTTSNRTVWLGFGVQAAILGGFMLLRREGGARRSSLPIALAAAAALAAGVAMTQCVHQERERAGSPALEKDARLDLWPEIIEKIRQRPVAGAGFGRGILRAELREKFEVAEMWHAHNLLLDAALQLGVAGLALLLLLLGATLRCGWQMARAPDLAAAACGMALIAVVAGMLVRNMTDMLWVRQNALLYWGVVGVLLAWGQSAQRSPRSA